ncbi:uncharacterized protein LOC122040150 [Zingiber officinale]|uniref:Uncharacterized protein n=1 Tax=Zingiber officinale TaxID=94328 RepID=A0A8J5I729_ZINOF|nr:uncharacterized protein LOC122040150 [Zingiber officinale]KAG6529762.1 hypothetical protein ZIOFF_011976 [Zingiber officinale]
MKKLGKGQARRVHPAPLPNHLAALPAAVMALAAVLAPEEQEVLAYLLSSNGGAGGGGGERRREWSPQRPTHLPELGCGCFGCYTSFWARWDASPNRQVIHRIIDAVEEGLASKERERGRRRRRSGRGGRKGAAFKAAAAPEEGKVARPQLFPSSDDDGREYDDTTSSVDGADEEAPPVAAAEEKVEDGTSDGDNSAINAIDKSSVRRFMTFIGERVWGVWN